MADTDHLLEKLRAGDDEAFTELVRRHNASLIGVAILLILLQFWLRG